MTDEKLSKLYDTLKGTLLKKGWRLEEAEDCAASAIEDLLRRKPTSYSFKWLIVDYIRKKFARHDYRKKFDGPSRKPDGTTPHLDYDILSGVAVLDSTDSIYKLTYIKKFLTRQQVEILEALIAGYTLKEIGKRYGFTAMWTHFQLRKIKAKLKDPLYVRPKPKKKRKEKMKVLCHPWRKHAARGKCYPCYEQWRKRQPGVLARISERKKARYREKTRLASRSKSVPM